MQNLFFILSGEHKSLPFAELRAIWDAECITYQEKEILPQVFRVNSTIDAIEAAKRRAALTRTCCIELFSCEASAGIIEKKMRSTSIKNLLRPDESFAVRIRRIGEVPRTLDGRKLERNLGNLIRRKVEAKVNLTEPQKTFSGVMTNGVFIFGVKLADVSPTPFVKRRPRKRPYFHPSAMPAKLARCMVNLAKPKQGDLMLDPFCGTGTFLTEAGMIGCKTLGFDVNRRMIEGTRQNLKAFNILCEGLSVADARNPPVREVDCVVTDPPYGRSSSTIGYTTKELIQGSLISMCDILSNDGSVCIAAPVTVQLGEIAKTLGLTPVQSHLIYVHRSLTREITVLERND